MTDEDYAIDSRSAAAPGGGVLTTVRLSGEFDLGACAALRAALVEAVPAGSGGEIVVDLAGMTFIDSETVRTLLDGHATAHRRGIGYRLAHPRGLVLRVLDVMGLTQLTWVGVSSDVP